MKIAWNWWQRVKKRKSPFPSEFDIRQYRMYYPALSKLRDRCVRRHYIEHGISEGLNASVLLDRSELIALIPNHASVLEIGPFYSPALRGNNVRYFDVIDRDEIVRRAGAMGVESPDPPHIDYVSPSADLSIVDRQFDYVISSNCIEHQPDLVGHLKSVERLLYPGGYYVIIAPDKRYCHDHFKPESTIADVIEAHVAKRTTHPLANLIKQGLNTHNEPWRHWAGDHGEPVPSDYLQQIKYAMFMFERANGDYVDSHSWFLTPTALRNIIRDINALELSNLTLHRCYETRLNTYEFWTVLRRKPT